MIQHGIIDAVVEAAAWGVVFAETNGGLGYGGDPWPVLRNLDRGPGFYLAWWKLALIIVVFLAWVRTTDWVSQDSQQARLHHRLWNSLTVFTFLAAFGTFWLLPWFWAGIAVLLAAYLGPLTAYIVRRNGSVDPSDRVLTREHLRYFFSTRLRPFGVKIEAEKADPRDQGPPVTFVPLSGPAERDDRANLLSARRSPGYQPTQRLLADMADRRVSAATLDLTANELRIAVQIDGVWHAEEAKPHRTGAAVLEVVQYLSGVQPQLEAVKAQGRFAVEYGGHRREYHASFAPTTDGQRATLRVLGERQIFASLAALGMYPEMEAKVAEIVGGNRGLVLFSALPASGLTTTFDTALDSTDRYLREFMALEDESRPEAAIENVPVVKYNSTVGQTPATILDQALRRYPNVLVVRQLPDATTVQRLCKQASGDQLVLSTIPAKDAVEALLRILALKVPPAALAQAMTAVVGQRLIRKLCDKCRQPYAPAGDVLKQLGLTGKVTRLFRATIGPQPNPAKPKAPPVACEHCNGIGYRGRTGLFEVLVIDETLRQVLAEQPKLELLRAAAKKAGLKTIQDHGIRLVAEGVTSVDELVRVLKL